MGQPPCPFGLPRADLLFSQILPPEAGQPNALGYLQRRAHSGVRALGPSLPGSRLPVIPSEPPAARTRRRVVPSHQTSGGQPG